MEWKSDSDLLKVYLNVQPSIYYELLIYICIYSRQKFSKILFSVLQNKWGKITNWFHSAVMRSMIIITRFSLSLQRVVLFGLVIWLKTSLPCYKIEPITLTRDLCDNQCCGEQYAAQACHQRLYGTVCHRNYWNGSFIRIRTCCFPSMSFRFRHLFNFIKCRLGITISDGPELET